MDSLQGIIRGPNSMSGNMRRRHRLACRPCRRPSRTILSYFTSSSMRRKRSLAYLPHPEHSCLYPCPTYFDSVPGALVFRVLLLKIRHDTLDTINCPQRQRLVVSLSHKLYNYPIFMRN
jgi:hypothetical protein